ncbi:hypothetical protein QQ045_023543 [Rhodiola kirilowii]
MENVTIKSLVLLVALILASGMIITVESQPDFCQTSRDCYKLCGGCALAAVKCVGDMCQCGCRMWTEEVPEGTASNHVSFAKVNAQYVTMS